ncbi:hypothetical protein JCM10212_000534 [Sporobolomyces blumeae]
MDRKPSPPLLAQHLHSAPLDRSLSVGADAFSRLHVSSQPPCHRPSSPGVFPGYPAALDLSLSSEDEDDDIIIDEESWKPAQDSLSDRDPRRDGPLDEPADLGFDQDSLGNDDETRENSDGHALEDDYGSDASSTGSSVSIQSYYSSSSSSSSARRANSPNPLNRDSSTTSPRTASQHPERTRDRSALFAAPQGFESPSRGIPFDPTHRHLARPDEPLPRPTWTFDPMTHAPFRDPGNPPGWVPEGDRELGLGELEEEKRREQDRAERDRKKRVLREPGQARWGKDWDLVEWVEPNGKNRKGKAKEGSDPFCQRSVSFFPYAEFEGLEWLKDTFAVVGGATVEISRCRGVGGSNAAPELLAQVTSRNVTPPHAQRDREEYLTCAWSVNTTTWPFTPMLAVAGRRRVIEIYLIGRRKVDGKVIAWLDRTMTGHGGDIFHLAFHPSRPHLLISASADRTMRLWDPTLPWGSDARVAQARRSEGIKAVRDGRKKKAVERGKKHQSEESRNPRPRVDGEVLGILAGHQADVFSCDFHPRLPLVVSASADGRIKLWALPESVLSATPTWPTPSTGLFRHPAEPPSRFVHPPLVPPIFSTIYVHPGQWPSQVQFVSPTSPAHPSTGVTVLSVAPTSHRRAGTDPRTSVKVWDIDWLSVLPDRNMEQHTAEADLLRSRWRGEVNVAMDRERERRAGGTKGERKSEGHGSLPRKSLKGVKPRPPPGEPDDLGFRVAKEAVVEGLWCVGDQVGVSRWSTFKSRRWTQRDRDEDDAESPDVGTEEEELFFVIPTMTRLPQTRTSSTDSEPALYFFRPFAPSETDFVLNESRRAKESVKVPSGAEKADARRAVVDHLFPKDRDRELHDFVPRLHPSLVVDLPRASTSLPAATRVGPSRSSSESDSTDDDFARPMTGRGEVVHFRCVAVSPGRGDWIVGVGDGGVRGVWRRTTGVKVSMEVV